MGRAFPGNVSASWSSFSEESPGFPVGDISGIVGTVEDVSVASGSIYLAALAVEAVGMISLTTGASSFQTNIRFDNFECFLDFGGERVLHSEWRFTGAAWYALEPCGFLWAHLDRSSSCDGAHAL
jgi:hypothetical protein